MHPLRTRSFFLLALAALVIALHAPRAWADAYDDMRLSWFNNLTGGTDYDAADPDVAAATTSLTNSARSYWTLLDASKPFSATGSPFSDIALGTASDNITAVYSRLDTMTLAYWAKGGALYQNADLKADIVSTLDWLNDNIYNAKTKQYGNWFAWLIGVPLDLNDITVLLYDSLTPAQRNNYTGAIDHFMYSPTQIGGGGGANGAWSTLIVGLRAVIVKDPTKLAAASANFRTLTALVTTPDGFYADGSYIGHGVFSYNGGYGLYLLQELAAGYYLFSPSALDPLPTDKRAVAYGWVFNSYQALMYQGKIPYYAIGREISRGPSNGRGGAVAAIVTELVGSDTSAAAARIRAFAKNIFTASGADYSGLGSINAVIRMKNVMADASVVPAADPVGTRIFPVMDKATAVQNGFGASIAYYSRRTDNYESINGENLKGWHQNDGLLYLDNADWNQYNGTFWATVDSGRLPGTTVTAGSTPAQGLANGNTFAGGADLGGQYGAVGFTLQPGNGQSLVANKSWFIFDDEVVCLGSGIASTDGKVIETIVENRKLGPAGDNLLTIDGTAQGAAAPWSSTQGVSWMHLAGGAAGSDIGYYFPGGMTLSLIREARTGRWSTLDATKSTTPVTDSYLTAVDSHGINPGAGNYAYVLLPNHTAAQVSAYAAVPVARILENDANISAVRDDKLGVSGAVFWQDQDARVQIDSAPTFVGSNKKAAVMVQDAGNGQVSVGVSDPTQANTVGINVEVSRAAVALVSADSGVTVVQLAPSLILNVATAGAKGKTFHAVFSTAAAAPQISDATINGAVGTVFSYQIIASNSPSNYAASGLPDGLSLDAAKGVISGVPTMAGSYNVAISAGNAGGTASATLTLIVAGAPAVVPAPIITGADAAESQVGQAFSYQIAATGTLTGYGATNLPAGLAVDTVSGLITGTPALAGVFAINLTATGPGGTATGTLTLTVATRPLPVVTVAATVPKALAGGADGAFTLQRTGDASRAMVVFFALKGTGRNGVDYRAIPGHKKFKAGKASVVVHVTAQGNMGGDPKRTVKLVVAGDDEYTTGTTGANAKVKLLPGN